MLDDASCFSLQESCRHQARRLHTHHTACGRTDAYLKRYVLSGHRGHYRIGGEGISSNCPTHKAVHSLPPQDVDLQ